MGAGAPGGEAERVAGGGVDKMGFGSSIKCGPHSKSDGPRAQVWLSPFAGIVLEVMATPLWRDERA